MVSILYIVRPRMSRNPGRENARENKKFSPAFFKRPRGSRGRSPRAATAVAEFPGGRRAGTLRLIRKKRRRGSPKSVRWTVSGRGNHVDFYKCLAEPNGLGSSCAQPVRQPPKSERSVVPPARCHRRLAARKRARGKPRRGLSPLCRARRGK